MSRVGNKPVSIPGGVTVKVAGQKVSVSGPKGNLDWEVPAPIKVEMEGSEVKFSRPDDQPENRSLHGLSRSLVANMVEGVEKGYERKLEIYGTGYGCKLQGNKLLLNLGHMGRGFGKAAQFIVDVPKSLDCKIEVEAARGESEPAKFSVSGIDKQQVNQFAAAVRALHKPEPYKGKGVRYAGEQIRRKAGKVFAGGG